ncbi:efflux RND transporter periplasmic adaptor subunit [Hyphomonas adhaerens]|uniref:efflux RND transporter periplasmic adaptor subunit n=1 Tax=Hyphomonas adhaerens TaxID=81029 RepID=UPI002356209B|nr:efflux RND transporter periplasmic adaptor subunit [Hyphomonas adhaerens]|tara:strand:+ start:43022 stop:44077 length:1056 start_codon:yes stop_codon:yes gene_type:complete
MVNWVLRTALAITSLAILGEPALSQTVEVSAASRKALGISTAPVRAESAIEGTRTFGTVITPPGNSTPVASPFEAVILETLVIPGMQVKAGDPVALLYSPDYETASAELESQRIMAEHMDHLLERALELRELGLRSAQEADEAEHDSKTAHLNLAAYQRRLSAVRSTGEAGRFKLVAPTSGTVASVSVDAGEAVGMSEPFLSIFDGKRYWLDVALPERVANTFSIGSTVSLAGSAGKGTVVAIDPTVDARLQSVRIKIELPSSTSWRLGQLVNLSLDAAGQENNLIIPAQAIVRINGVDCVFIDTGSGFRRAEVSVLTRSREDAVLSGGVSSGDQVAVSGLAALKNLAEGV